MIASHSLWHHSHMGDALSTGDNIQPASHDDSDSVPCMGLMHGSDPGANWPHFRLLLVCIIVKVELEACIVAALGPHRGLRGIVIGDPKGRQWGGAVGSDHRWVGVGNQHGLCK
jgi:hypothetical protein